MRRLLLAALVALSPGLALAQEPSNSIYLPAGLSPSSGLIAGWNSIAPGYCYGFAYGTDLVVKLVATDNTTYIQSRNSSVHGALMIACAANKRIWVYSTDGLTWNGMFVSASPGG